jgi:hypothetical protein
MLPRMTSATRAIKVSEKAHRQLRMLAAKTGMHIYEIVDEMVKEQKEYSHLMFHAAHRDHKFSPERCDGCKDIEKLIERRNGTNKDKK